MLLIDLIKLSKIELNSKRYYSGPYLVFVYSSCHQCIALQAVEKKNNKLKIKIPHEKFYKTTYIENLLYLQILHTLMLLRVNHNFVHLI